MDNFAKPTGTSEANGSEPSLADTYQIASDLFARIADNPVSAQCISVEDLFDLASSLAVSGQLALKNEVYSWIATHPKATSDDRLRVQINCFDWMRRQGLGEEALAKLQDLPSSDNPLVQIEHLQATNQCLLQLSATNDNRVEEASLLIRASLNQTLLCDIARWNGHIAPDKKIYYLVVLCEIRGRLMAANGATQDVEIEDALTLAEAIARSEQILSPFRERLEWELPCIRGDYLRNAGRFEEALGPLSVAWIELRTSANERVKAAVALDYVYCHLQAGHSGSDVFNEASSFYIAGGRDSLLQGDKRCLQRYMELVDRHLLGT